MDQILIFILYVINGIILCKIYEFIFTDIFKGKYGIVLNGFKLHHSLYGVIAYILAFPSFSINYYAGLILLGMGTGIIFQHTISEGQLIFLERNIDASVASVSE